VEKVRYPTVQQPNSLAFDDTSDTLYVVSATGAGVQVIRNAAGAR
jgi:sugar lactone lactonase YvrE